MKTLASVRKCVHTCEHWPESSLLVRTKNVCTCVHASVRRCLYTFFVCTSSEDSGQYAHACIPCSVHKEDPCSVHKESPCKCAHVRTLARVFTACTHKECLHMCACNCAHVCAHILCVYEQRRLWEVCVFVHTCMDLLITPTVYINFVQNIHQIQVLTKPLCCSQAIFMRCRTTSWVPIIVG